MIKELIPKIGKRSKFVQKLKEFKRESQVREKSLFCFCIL